MSWRRRGVYVWRTKKPHAPIGLPIIGRHTAYVGQSSSHRHRERQHLGLDIRYGAPAASWSDLEPKRYTLWVLFPGWRRARLAQEWLWIKLLMPVYNDQHNRWNPRRISRRQARAQREARDARRSGRRPLSNWAVDMLLTSVRLIIVATLLAGWIGWRAMT